MSNLIEKRNRIREAVPHLASASGSIASFQTDMRSNLEEIKIHFNPVQAAGTPSPTNVLPISGWTGAVIGNTAKNFFDTAYLADASHYTTTGAYGYTYTDVMYLKPNTEYVLSASNPGAAVNPYGYMVVYVFSGTETVPNAPGSGKSLVNYSSSLGYGLVTTTIFKFTTGPLGAIRVGVNKGNNSTIQDAINTIFASSGFQVEPGSTASSYEQFVGNQIPVSWSELGTVYGGWVNPISGEVWAEWEYGDMGDLRWDSASSVSSTYVRDRSWVTAYGGNSNARPYLYCDQTDAVSYNVFNNSIGISGHFAQINSGGYFYYMSPDISGFTSTQVKTFLTGQKYVIKSTPTLVGTISPIALKTLVGANNIWANMNGNIDVKYWKH